MHNTILLHAAAVAEEVRLVHLLLILLFQFLLMSEKPDL